MSLIVPIIALSLIGCSNSTMAVEPAPPKDMPDTIQVKGQEIDLKALKNPLRSDSKNLEKNIHDGGEVYFKNCFLCHGDLLDGDGLFGKNFFPPAADFTHSSSILSKPESYTYWRIIKGGKGLPKKSNPWDSAMPAWETQLEEEEVWKVILFIYETVKERNQPPSVDTSQASLELGKKVYEKKCVYCHGETGQGDGVSKPYSSPQPRRFSKGHYKFRTTPFGKIATDSDIFNMITHGMPGTTMPGWKHLPEVERWGLVAYLKSLTKKFEKFKKRGKTLEIIEVPDPPPFTVESLASGKELFAANCSGCHGLKGLGDGESTHKIVDIPTDAIWPRNLSKPWNFRRGSTRKDIFLTLRTGLSTTSMPRFSPKIFEDQQIWDIVNYVETLSPSRKPPVKPVIKVAKVDDLPSGPDDPIWKLAESYYFPLGGQIIQSEKLFFPAVDSLVVKALYNGEELAMYLHWDDPNPDPILSTLTSVEVSPPPPLPPHLQVMEEEEDEEQSMEEPKPQEFPDSIAVQFPVAINDEGEKPYFLNGDKTRPVNLWKWSSYPMQAVDMNATGIDQWTKQSGESQEIESKASFKYGRYHLVLKRKLETQDKKSDVQFQSGVSFPIAFNVWDGSQGETESKKAISSWFQMKLE